MNPDVVAGQDYLVVDRAVDTEGRSVKGIVRVTNAPSNLDRHLRIHVMDADSHRHDVYMSRSQNFLGERVDTVGRFPQWGETYDLIDGTKSYHGETIQGRVEVTGGPDSDGDYMTTDEAGNSRYVREDRFILPPPTAGSQAPTEPTEVNVFDLLGGLM